MAAYAALVSLMNDLELIPNHPTHSFSFDTKQITTLSQIVHSLIDFMETFDSHGYATESAEILETRIASAAHAAHHVIESHVVDQLLTGTPSPDFSLDLQKSIEDLHFVVEIVAKQFNKSKIGFNSNTYSPHTSSEFRSSGNNVMVGFDAAVVRLMEMLTFTGGDSSQRVVPVVGMGGMGKATLAGNVYNHLLIQQHFDIRCWATISQEFSVDNVLTQLLFENRKTDGDAGRLGEELHKLLWGRRYLIVLDDMWSLEAWDDTHMFFPDNGNGSCVVVTTRLANLAAHLSSSPLQMNFLDEEKSWDLFRGKAFGEEDCPVELEEIGRKIVKRCRGLPLSIVVIGGHLRRSSRAVEYWEKVAGFINPISSIGEDEQCLNIISLSYYHLPACLKPCFLYVGIFQEDERIDASKLLRYWVSEGFIKPNGSSSLEEVAEDYLKDLIDRNLILVVERRWNGKAQFCVIHDIVRELCLKVAKKEEFMCVLDTTQGVGREHRIVIPEGKSLGALESPPLLLRSLILRPRRLGQLEFDRSSLFSRLLRVSAYATHIFLGGGRCFPAAHFQQVNLRCLIFYVTCCYPGPYLIPSSISQLWNLQTLIIHHDGVCVTAPYEIWEMTQLRHLELDGVCLADPVLKQRERECIVLENLQRLVGVKNLRLTKEVCERIPNIKELAVDYEHPKTSSKYCLHNLTLFSKLESLKLSFGSESEWRDVVLSLSFPSSLEELCLLNCHLDWEELNTRIKSLSNLGYLELHSVKGSKWEQCDQEFSSLKVLMMSDCDELVYWNANSSHFPILEALHICGASKLSLVPSDIGEIPTLQVIRLESCSVSAAISTVRIVMEQESLGNQDLQPCFGFDTLEEFDEFHKMLKEEGLPRNRFRLVQLFFEIKGSVV
ncbi:putative late blight resistance protein homolog R1B-16 [Salvia hispanica]|uniref:putative late blight resistance protein homolog R1B-16 n=1 Tax=Salvia hispanica TaxID=49212 RepID=UPI002009D572|nr:putative late blight resistance protein homolog R1B-16 [Salvia hispanica]